QENYRLYILSEVKDSTKLTYDQKRESLIKSVKGMSVDSEETFSQVKKELLQLLLIKHEVLKYELFSLLHFNKKSTKTYYDIMIKNIFTELYILSNYEEELQDLLPQKES